MKALDPESGKIISLLHNKKTSDWHGNIKLDLHLYIWPNHLIFEDLTLQTHTIKLNLSLSIYIMYATYVYDTPMRLSKYRQNVGPRQ